MEQAHRKQYNLEDIMVRTRISVTRLLDIDLVSQRFTVEVLMEASWIDPTHTHGQTRPGRQPVDHPAGKWVYSTDTHTLQKAGEIVLHGSDGQEGRAFAPRLEFSNIVEEKESEMWYCFYNTLSKEGDKLVVCCLRWSLVGVFQASFRLHSFPFDTQTLVLRLKTGFASSQDGEKTRWWKGRRKVVLEENKNPRYRSFVSVCDEGTGHLQSEYVIGEEVEFDQGLSRPEASAEQLEYATLSIRFNIKRKPAYWMWNIVLPLFFIVSSAICSFFVPRAELADRTAITVTLLLALVAFKLVLSEKIPKLSYLTRVDEYIIVCFVSVASMIIWQTVSAVFRGAEPMLILHNASDYGDAPEREAIQVSWVGIVYGGLWGGLHLVLGTAYCCMDSRKAHKYDHNALYMKKPTSEVDAVDMEAHVVEHLEQKLDSSRKQEMIVNSWTQEEVAAVYKTKGRKVPSSLIKSDFSVVHFKDPEDAKEALKQLTPQRLYASRGCSDDKSGTSVRESSGVDAGSFVVEKLDIRLGLLVNESVLKEKNANTRRRSRSTSSGRIGFGSRFWSSSGSTRFNRSSPSVLVAGAEAAVEAATVSSTSNCGDAV
jgi:hypothetical protein